MKESVEFCNKMQDFIDSKLLQFFVDEEIDREISTFVITSIIRNLYQD